MSTYTYHFKPLNPYTHTIYSKYINKQNENEIQNIQNRDSGLDLYIPKDITISPGETVKIPLGIKCELKNTLTDYNMAYFLYPRSSIYKTPLRLANSVGIIDQDYRGELMAIVDHIKSDEQVSYTIKKGTRLFQLCIPSLDCNFKLQFSKELSQTIRGEGGLGSTGF